MRAQQTAAETSLGQFPKSAFVVAHDFFGRAHLTGKVRVCSGKVEAIFQRFRQIKGVAFNCIEPQLFALTAGFGLAQIGLVSGLQGFSSSANSAGFRCAKRAGTGWACCAAPAAAVNATGQALEIHQDSFAARRLEPRSR